MAALGLVAFGRSALADAPSGYVFAITDDAELEPFAIDAVDTARRELHRAGLVDTSMAEALIHGVSPEDSAAIAQARSLYSSGREAYELLELDRAISHLARCVGLLDGHLRTLDDFDLYVDAWLRLGAAHVLSGQGREAEAAFTRVTTVAPQRSPDPEIYPAQVTSLFSSVAGRARRAGTGTLELTVGLEGAIVYVDGQVRGRAPIRVDELPPGNHVVRVRMPGYHDQAAATAIRARRVQALALELEPTDGMERLPELVAELPDRTEDAAEELRRLLGLDRIIVIGFSAAEAGTISVRAHAFANGRSTSRLMVDVGADPEGIEGVVRLALAAARDGAAAMATTEPRRRNRPRWSDTHSRDSGGGVTSSYWFWTAVGAAVIGGAALAIALSSGSEAEPGGTGELVLRF